MSRFSVVLSDEEIARGILAGDRFDTDPGGLYDKVERQWGAERAPRIWRHVCDQYDRAHEEEVER